MDQVGPGEQGTLLFVLNNGDAERHVLNAQHPMHRFIITLAAALFLSTLSCGFAQRRDAVLEDTLKPYSGESVRGVDTSTLTGKVMCGYQGWFNCEGDGAERGWVHWTKGRKAFNAETVKVDLWPEMSEYAADERFATELKHANGKPAEVFSSFKRDTVHRHFRWMREYGIDGAFVQRFATELRDPRGLRHFNTVLGHCREAANQNGRAYVVMYDLSGLRAGGIDAVIEDWRQLRTRMRITEDPAYLRHRGKPLVAVWGIGFNDKREYTLAECERLISTLKDDPEIGGCTVMVGIPTYWREQKADAVRDPDLHRVLQMADVLSPWTVGRYRTPEEAERHADKVWKADIEWCRDRKLDYLPVAFPGFSWHHMHGGPLDAIPRRRGGFLWSQVGAAKRAGAGMLYVAMFDEVDEGTAIFKVTNDPPAGAGAGFVTEAGLPADFYLKLTGAAGRVFRSEVEFDPAHPARLLPAGQ